MKTQKYTVAIEVAKPPKDVFDHLINDVPKYWPEEMDGKTTGLNDEFIFRTGDSHYSKNKVVEFVPDKKLVWLVTESIRKTDGFDWTGSKMIFELTHHGGGTRLTFTYDGVTLEDESDRLVQICDMVIKENLYNLLTNASYTAIIEVANPPKQVFDCLTTHVAKWWGGQDLEGTSTKLNAAFTINHPGAHYSKQKVTEYIPDQKLVWLVTESKLSWLNKQDEWTNTKMIFTITSQYSKTHLHFTHEGLTPDKESYATCSGGWNMVIKDYLFHFIVDGKPHF